MGVMEVPVLLLCKIEFPIRIFLSTDIDFFIDHSSFHWVFKIILNVM